MSGERNHHQLANQVEELANERAELLLLLLAVLFVSEWAGYTECQSSC
jgi:hypothetical protein